MIRSVNETGLEPQPVARTAANPKPSSGGGFAAELADAKTKDSATPANKAPTSKAAVVKGERTDPIEGHPYAQIVAGPRNGMFLNTSGNERSGQAFLRIEREGRTFHVYGSGADRAVFEVKPEQQRKPQPATPTAGTTSPAAVTPTAGTVPATSPAGAATPGITTPVPVATPTLPTLPLPGTSSPSF